MPGTDVTPPDLCSIRVGAQYAIPGACLMAGHRGKQTEAGR
jgi:hypothetical protein